jgi:hypothetical protein
LDEKPFQSFCQVFPSLLSLFASIIKSLLIEKLLLAVNLSFKEKVAALIQSGDRVLKKC